MIASMILHPHNVIDFISELKKTELHKYGAPKSIQHTQNTSLTGQFVSFLLHSYLIPFCDPYQLTKNLFWS